MNSQSWCQKGVVYFIYNCGFFIHMWLSTFIEVAIEGAGVCETGPARFYFVEKNCL